jgi:hypothetical protein
VLTRFANLYRDGFPGLPDSALPLQRVSTKPDDNQERLWLGWDAWVSVRRPQPATGRDK